MYRDLYIHSQAVHTASSSKSDSPCKLVDPLKCCKASQTTSDHYDKVVLEDTEYRNGYHVTVHACVRHMEYINLTIFPHILSCILVVDSIEF